jgi:hypothetical protein
MRNLVLFGILLAACEPVVEPTFMPVCWDAGVAFYSPQGKPMQCATGATTIHWDHMPLSVYVAYDEESRDLYADVREAMTLWNRVIPAFDLIGERDDADVVITFDSVGDSEWAAAKHRIVDGRMRGYASCRQCALSGHTYVVLGHELGHVLGLAHDPQTISIMHGTVDSPLSEGGEFTNPVRLVTHKDQTALRKRY